jgi:hypothetical protein
MAAKKEVEKEKLIYLIKGEDCALPSLKDLEDCDLEDGTKVDIYKKVGTKTVKRGDFSLV